jgi:hypothetical protein
MSKQSITKNARLQTICFISTIYSFHLIFSISAVPVLDTIMSPTNVMIGLLHNRIGNYISLLLCFLMSIDAVFLFNLPYALVSVQLYGLWMFPVLLILGTAIRFGQSLIFYRSLKNWII